MRRLTWLLGVAAVLVLVLTQAAAAFEFDEASRIPPDGVAGKPYSFVFKIEEGGGCPPYTFHVLMGQLPPGLTLVEQSELAGTVNGTPTAAGSYDFWLQAQDSAPGGCGNPPDRPKAHTERLMTIRIWPALAIDQQALSAALVNTPYSFQLTAGAGTLVWSLASGTLPPGITLSSDGLLSGTPTATGSFTFGVTAFDAAFFNRRDTRTLTLNVVQPMTASAPASTPAAEVGRPFVWTPSAAGGTAPYTWTISQGALPAGLALDKASGTISGAPLAAGPVSATLSVTDANALTAKLPFALDVTAKLALATKRLGPAKVGRTYRAALRTRGGIAPLHWKASGKLPPGIRFNTTSGVFSGTARQAGAFRVTVQVTDRLGATAKQVLPLNVLR